MTTARTGRFGAVVTAMVTPFDDDGDLDVDAAVSLAKWLASSGSDALVVAGTTGEGAVLSDGEKRTLWSAVASGAGIPVIAATGTADTRHSIELTKAAQECGVDGILAVTPYYNRPSQHGIFEHFRALAGATNLPVVLYDIPFRTGRRIAFETMLKLIGECPNIIGVKDATSDVPSTQRLIGAAPSTFDVYSGDDAHALAVAAIGGVGVVSVASHWAGPEFADMLACLREGEVGSAAEINLRLIPSYEFESGDEAPNPIPAKAMMRVLGQRAGQCRLPLGAAPEWVEDRARNIAAALGKLPPR